MQCKKQLLVSFLTGFIFFVALESAAAPSKLGKIEYSDAQSRTIKDVVAKLKSRHYRELNVDDTLSQEYLENYLDTLDPSRMFFYAEDINTFQKHSKKFDDDFLAGDLSAAFDVYHVYRQRAVSRLESVLELLEDPAIKFKFDDQDEVMLDREGQPWPESLGESDKLWHKRLKLSLLNLKLAGKNLEEAKEIVAKRYQRQLTRVMQEDTADVFETVANALTMLYDPHTNYWSPRTTENFNIHMRLSLEGIGAVLQSEEEFTKVVRLVPGGPADKQGQLKPTDKIVAVGQGDEGEMVDVVGWRLDEVVDLIRGPKDTVVKLEVKDDPENKIIRISRQQVKLEDQAAQKEIIEIPEGDKVYKLGIINLPTFYVDFDGQRKRKLDYKSSSNDVARLLRELQKENIDGLILDLRNNGGGSLQEAVKLTDLFIDQGPVVQIRSPDNRISRHQQSMFNALYDGPLVVLVNRLSASASEIFAGAIQDYNRGIIIGTQTFGKGTVQSVNPVIEGGLKLTESKFYRVSGDSTQHRGVIPDISIPNIIDPEQVGESAYDNALPWDQIQAAPHADYFDFSSLLPVVKSLHEQRTASDPDYTYLLDRVAIMESNRDKETISLNENVRLQEKRDMELKQMGIENKRRIATGKKPFESLKDFRAQEEQEEEVAESEQAQPEPLIDVEEDTVLRESGNILVDIIRLAEDQMKKQRQASR